MRVFRFLGPYKYQWYTRPLTLGIIALIVAGMGVSYIGATDGARGWYGGLIAVTAALGIAVFAYAALWFQPPVATVTEEGAVTLAWLRSETAFHAREIAAIRWVCPRSWRKRPIRGLENYRIDLADRRLRFEAAPIVIHEFAQAMQALNPTLRIDLPAEE